MIERIDDMGVVFIGNYLPRRCGIATFTTDICEAVAREMADPATVFSAVMNDVPEGYDYPDRVKLELGQNAQADYLRAADFINFSRVSAACLQHEYGIYGGDEGSNILLTLRQLRVPVVTTLHTVLENPNPSQKKVLQEICELSARVVVMSERALGMLNQVYSVKEGKALMIPHGIPDVPFMDPNYYKDKFNVEGRRVVLTFGLLSPDKGIENMIEAIAKVVAKHRDVVYIILGATHPAILRSTGDEYRISLRRRVDALGLNQSVIFQNRFVELEELCEFLGMADIYVTPYLKQEQITSGTLAYSLGAGKAVISTPYWYAEEMLADGRGILVPFRDPDALADSMNLLLDDEVKRHGMRKKAYQYCRSMVWKEVSRAYLTLFSDVIQETKKRSVKKPVYRSKIISSTNVPEPKMDHLLRLTDSTGILQHASYTIPKYEHGYCLDDNARALVVATKYYRIFRDTRILRVLTPYLAFTQFAQREDGWFKNFLTYDRRFADDGGSDDCFGRALWGLGYTIAFAPTAFRALAKEIFDRAVPKIDVLNLRGSAYAILGLHYYLDQYSGAAEMRRLMSMLGERLVSAYRDNEGKNWKWFEQSLNYGNAIIPHALFLAAYRTNQAEFMEIAEESLDFLFQEQLREDHLSLVGSNGWYPRGGKKAQFDQQPIDASKLIEACKTAYRRTKKKIYLDRMRICFDWFLGNNDVGVPIYDFRTGGCNDGLTPTGANLNQGAESTLSFLLSLMTMYEISGLMQDTVDEEQTPQVGEFSMNS
ncbi:MAG: glycosyltransferase family 4 protein [Planctomycetota bacterium]|jgi:glycosyltransferase involved in cell wall biosynthesis